ncbi:MAG: hypothetical protein LBQ59_01475 [Candidatus Peribacteria bacterium]|nr:hypothetical protein [Candidatus Peribacteria bacterium]
MQEFLSLKFALNGVKLGTFDDKTYQMLWAYQRNNGLKTD